MSVNGQFARRLCAIAPHGLGLSADVYTPDLFDLMAALAQADAPCDYLELFKASTGMLHRVRRRLPTMPLAYHGEGLWLTDPDFPRLASLPADLADAERHLQVLGAAWINHECAAKQIGGYAFGTYLPPLFTNEAADVVAENAAWLQAELDTRWDDGRSPLLLIEIPPLTYAGMGTMPVAAFFRRLAVRAACGFVLDLGHVWTHYRYAVAEAASSVSLPGYLEQFLEEFPLERVVQIHVAGLGRHATDRAPAEGGGPRWIDAHAEPIPAALWDMLDTVLQHPRLVSLRGVALEVDTKPIPIIAAELQRARRTFGSLIAKAMERAPPLTECADMALDCRGPAPLHDLDRGTLAAQYRRYAEHFIGKSKPADLPIWGGPALLDRYRGQYLPYEILTWGGELRNMFPRTCGLLDEAGVANEAFVRFWFREPRPVVRPYDFFILKVERFRDFVSERHPAAAEVARAEAADLLDAYAMASEQADALAETAP